MKFARKLICLATILTMLGTSTSSLQADDCAPVDNCCVNNGGCGYDACCRSSSLAPAIALGTIALIAIVAVAVQNTSGHTHCHSH
jgi:hypothetical protein